MATIPATASGPPAGPAAQPRAFGGPLWQAPAFLAGCLCLLSAGALHALRGDPEARQFKHDLATVRQLLDQPGADLDAALELAESVLRRAPAHPQQAGPAHFLLGSTYLRRADRGGPGADENYRLARKHLEEALSLGVAPADRPRLSYRLGKACYQTGEPPQRVLDYLADSVAEGAEDAAEGCGLLAQNYLRLPNPNLEAALEANTRLLNLPAIKEEALAAARLQRGELLLALRDAAGARKALESVRPPAPGPVLARAHLLLAGLDQAEQRWAEAAAAWADLLDRPEAAGERGRILYQAGLCHHQLNQPREAARYWEMALEQAGEEEQRAAALGLAELRRPADPAGAVAAFERAVHRLQGPAGWKNALVDLATAQERFERACQACRAPGRHEFSRQLAAIYESIAPPGRARYQDALAAEDWARLCQEQARQASRPEQAALARRAAGELYRQAAGSYQAAVGAECAPAEKVDRLWQAAQCYLWAHDQEAARKVLVELTEAGLAKERLAEGWYRLAEVCREAGDEKSALAAFRECVAQPGKYAYRARFHLAMHRIAEGDLDGAQDDLIHNQALLAVDMDPEAHENTVFELANLLFHRHDYRQAASRLENALEAYKDTPRAASAQFQLAECYRHLAERDVQNMRETDWGKVDVQRFYYEQYRRHLGDAAGTYFDLAGVLSRRREKAGRLTAEEEDLFTRSLFFAAECRFQLGSFLEALAVYTNLAGLCDNRVERLHALAGKRQCYWALRDTMAEAAGKARATLDDVALTLKALNEAAFDPQVSRWTRRQWHDWLKQERDRDSWQSAKPAVSPGSGGR